MLRKLAWQGSFRGILTALVLMAGSFQAHARNTGAPPTLVETKSGKVVGTLVKSIGRIGVLLG